ncbi:DUF58 domain-containing protein [Paenibacillus sp. sgz302251]|uniref:DUF58 domain-containing protein n=1 Tax=Paenibacillus sp. sgz302251 TaxID=3414493 RepID=UPI003C7CCC72
MNVVDREQLAPLDAVENERERIDARTKGASTAVVWEDMSAQSVYRTRWLAWTVIAVGFAGSLAAAVQRGGAVELFLAAVLGMIILISGVFPRIAAAGITAARLLPSEETRDGGTIEVRLTVKRSFFVPFVWMAVHDAASNECSASRRVVRYSAVLRPTLKCGSESVYMLHKLHRGRHSFEYADLTVGDWLGLTAVHKRLLCRSAFVVLPGLPESDALESWRAGSAPVGETNTRLLGASRDRRGEAAREEIAAAVRAAGIGPESRPYREGDSLRHLDWRSAAKGRGLQTKLFSLEQPCQTFIVFDTNGSAYAQDDRLFDACAGWAAFAVKQAAIGSAVTLLTEQAAAAERAFAVEERSGSVSDMLRRLAMLRADGKGSLAFQLMKSGQTLERGGTMLVFTADWRGGRSWGELAGYAAERGCRLELFIVTRSSVLSFAMREQQKWLESGGIKVTWLDVPADMSELPYAEEGGAAHDYAQ